VLSERAPHRGRAATEKHALALARDHGVRTIAFPAISCGVYGYPIEEAVAIAVREVTTFTKAHRDVSKIIFACFSDDVLEAYRAALAHADRDAPSGR